VRGDRPEAVPETAGADAGFGSLGEDCPRPSPYFCLRAHARSPMIRAGVPGAPRYHQNPDFCSVNSITSITRLGPFTTTPGRSESPVEQGRETPMTAVEMAALTCELVEIDKTGAMTISPA